MKTARWLAPRRLLPALAVLALIILATRAHLGSAPRPAVTSALVTRGSLEEGVLATGTIAAARQVSVGAQATGEVRRLYVALGDPVRQGQLIAEIDSKQQDNELLRASAAVRSAQADLAARQAASRQADLASSRLQRLVAIDAGSRADLEAAEATAEGAHAAIDVAQAAIAQARLAQDTARVNVGYTRVVAPMDGTVVAIVTEQGQTVNAVQMSPTIIKLARLDAMTVKAQISEADVLKVRAGMRVHFTLLGDPDQRYEATLRAVEPGPTTMASDNTTPAAPAGAGASAVYYDGIFDVANPQGRLRIAMTAQATIVVQAVRDALLIPAAALGARGDDGRYAVRVVMPAHDGEPGGGLLERRVRVGLNNHVQAQVLDGLSLGEQVVTSEASPNGTPASGVDGSVHVRAD